MERLNGPGVAEMCALWAERCAPSPAWARLAEFATADAARTSWTAEVETRAGARLEVLAAPLPDASALVVFRARAAEDRPAGLAALALEELRGPAEAAVQKLAAAIPNAPSTAAFQALSGAAQGLRDGLARVRDLEALGAEDGLPLAGVASALARRGLRLELPDAAQGWTADERRVAMALAFAAADAAAPEATIAVSGGGAALTARVAAARPPRGEGMGLALARRVVEEAGGRLEATAEDGTATFAASLAPAARRLRSA
jgi:hypothetical protein